MLKETVLDMLTTQDEGGRFSSYTADREFFSWDMWGRKYVMLGMIYFIDICKSESFKRKTAILRSDTQNDAIFDPDVCGTFVFCGTLLVVLGCRERAV